MIEPAFRRIRTALLLASALAGMGALPSRATAEPAPDAAASRSPAPGRCMPAWPFRSICNSAIRPLRPGRAYGGTG
jgi:hypothetical protein